MKSEWINIKRSLIVPALFVLLIWAIFVLEELSGINLRFMAMRPGEIKGLIGILTSPLLHGDWDHLFSNSVPLLVLGSCFMYFYRQVAWTAGFWLYVLPGLSLWIMGRNVYHIGASGVVYSFAFFLLLSGFIRKNKSLLATSFIVTILYGYLVWGVLPIDPQISWEGHLGGLLSGIILALVYRKQGPEDEKPHHFDDSDLDDVEPYWEVPDEGVDEEARPIVFRYRYRKNE